MTPREDSNILKESDVLNDISLLDQAWQNPETFILLPDQIDKSVKWISNALNSLPEELRTQHFALLTSGSTGEAKIVIGARARTENLARILDSKQDSQAVKAAVLCLPLSYSYAFVNQYVWSRVMGKELITSKGLKEPDLLKHLLMNAQDAMICLIGAQIPLLIHNFGDPTFPGIIRVHFAGGQFPQQWIDKIKSMFPSARIYNNYGCVEAMPRLTLRPLEDSDDGANIGCPLPGIEMKTDGDGSILFKSPYRAVAFYDANGLKMVSDEDWTASGDLGEEIGNGYWRILGRSNEVFKRYGEKISLSRLLTTVSAVWPNHAAMFRKADPSGEDGYVLVLSPSPEQDDVRKILLAFRKNHPRTHWPLQVEGVESMPLLKNGKIDTLALNNLQSKTVHWKQRIIGNGKS